MEWREQIMSGIARTGTEYGISWALEVGLIGWWVSLGEPEIYYARTPPPKCLLGL